MMKTLLIPLVKGLNAGLRQMLLWTHAFQHRLEWRRPQKPEWYDHFLDQYFSWPRRGYSYWLERGVFNRLALKPRGKTLELCCGDGFNTRFFYSEKSSQITAVDYNDSALAHAKAYNSRPNIQYIKGDIREGLPAGMFDNVVWDGSLQHFSPEEMEKIFKMIKAALSPDGVFSGATVAVLSTGSQLEHHKHEFHSKEELQSFLKPWFKKVYVFENIHPDRHHLIFYASDQRVPFERSWPFAVTSDAQH